MAAETEEERNARLDREARGEHDQGAFHRATGQSAGDSLKKALDPASIFLKPSSEAPVIDRPDETAAAPIQGEYGTREEVDEYGNTRSVPVTATEYFDQQGEEAQAREAAQIERGAQVADTTMADASGVDELALQARGAQSSLVSALQNRAAGQAPSVAELQLQRSRDANIRAAQAQAAGQVGLSAGQAARLALQQAGAANQEAAGQAAVLRATEMSQAEQNLATTLQGQRGQDIQASQQMQERLLAEFKIDANSAIAQAGFDTQTLLANLRSEQGQRAMNDKMTEYYLNLGFSRDEADRQAAIEMEKIKAEVAVAQAKLQAEAGSDDGLWGKVKDIAGGVGTAVSSSDSGGEGDTTSDIRAKENISTGPSDNNKIQSFLDSLEASGWEYKDPERHGKGRKYGVMAQDLEESEVGDTMVVDKPDGKAINVTKGFGPVLAALSHLNEKQKRLEELIKLNRQGGM